MKNLVRNAFILSLLVFSSVVFAQQMQKKSPEQRADNQTRWMQENLGITDDQNKKVYDILLYYAREADNANASQSLGKKEVRRDKDAELRATLTGDQYQKYQAHVQEMKEKMRERRMDMQNGN